MEMLRISQTYKKKMQCSESGSVHLECSSIMLKSTWKALRWVSSRWDMVIQAAGCFKQVQAGSTQEIPVRRAHPQALQIY